MRTTLLAAIIVVSMIIGASTLTRGHEWGDDFASYIMQAESIWHGDTDDFVEHNSFTIFQSSNQIGPVAYPWGYPLILTPAYALKGIHPLALKLPGLFFYAGFLICLYLLLYRRLTQAESLLIVCLFAFNPLLVRFLDQILSDIPFLFFSTLALLVMTDTRPRTNRQLVLIGIIISIAYFVRTTGILLLASLLAVEFREWLGHREESNSLRRHGISMFIVCGTFGLFFLINILSFPEGETSHLLRFQEFSTETATGFAGSYFGVFGSFFGESLAWQRVYYVLFVFFLIGAWIRGKQDSIFIAFFTVWMIVLIAWPSWQGPRFIFPLLPIFIYFTFQGMKFILAKLPEKNLQTGQWIFYGFWALLLFAFLFTSIQNAATNLQNDRAINGPFDPFSNEVYSYIKEETPADSVIVFFKPRAMRLMTNHDSLMSTECDRVLKGDFLVLSKKVGENQQIPPEKIGACNLPLTEVLTNNRFIVFQIQK